MGCLTYAILINKEKIFFYLTNILSYCIMPWKISPRERELRTNKSNRWLISVDVGLAETPLNFFYRRPPSTTYFIIYKYRNFCSGKRKKKYFFVLKFDPNKLFSLFYPYSHFLKLFSIVWNFITR